MDYGRPATETWGQRKSYLESYFSKRNARLDPNAEYGHADRAWRNKWMKAQHFSVNDHTLDLERNPDYRKARYNPIRRLWRAPMNFVEFNILSHLHKDWRVVKGYRIKIVTIASLFATTWTIGYYCLYKGNNWTERTGWKAFIGKPMIYPGSKEWPHTPSYHYQNKDDFACFDFKQSGMTEVKSSTPLRYMG